MLFHTPKIPRWNKHIESRFAEAIDVSLIDRESKLCLEKSQFFFCRVDGTVIDSIKDADPRNDGVDHLLRQKIHTTQDGWIRRTDFFEETFTYICDEYLSKSCLYRFLIFDEFAKKEDKFLDGKPFFVKDELVYFVLDINQIKNSFTESLQVFRSARHLSFLGVVYRDEESSNLKMNATKGIFVCDVFDGDSLILTPFIV